MSKKKNDKKKQLIYTTVFTTIVLIIIVFFLIAGLIKLVSNSKAYYKISSRVDKIEEYTKKHEETKAVGWIRVQGTNIDYPIIYAARDININAIIDDFTWIENDVNTLKNKVYILGHNIRNISSNPLITNKEHTRFEQLPSFMYLDFAEKNKYIQYTVDGKDYLYKIFSVSIVENKNLSTETADISKENLREYIKQSKKDSYYDFDVDVDENDYIITLATCTRFYGATSNYTYKIDARMVRDKESIHNYSVKENKNYKKVKKIMEGGEKNANQI